jgi:hypothetical protein
MPDTKVFDLAGMSRGVSATTAAYFVLGLALYFALPTQGMPWVMLLLAAVALGTWLWMRPSRFEIDAEALVIRWPLRRRYVPLGSIQGARLVDAAELGTMIRIGVGGLFGAFGLFRTSRMGTLEGYFSDRQRLVLIQLKKGRPLLLSPEDGAGFVRALGFS